VTARSLPPLPAALAAKLAPSPRLRPRPVTTQGNPYGTGPTATAAAPARCDECGARATRATTNGAVVFRWCAAHAPAAAPTRPTGARKRSRTHAASSAATAAPAGARGASAPLSVTVPLRLASEPNERGSWRRTARRTTTQRAAVARALRAALAGRVVALPCVVVLVRLAPRALDSDNAVSSAKHARDGAADALGIDDGDPRVRWDVRQERARQFAVRVEVHEGARDCGHCAGRGWTTKGATR